MFKESSLDFILFPSTPSRKLHPKISELINNSVHTSSNYYLNKNILRFSILIWILGLVTNKTFPAYLIKKIIIKNSISKIHAIEINHAGYLVARSFELGLPANIKIISTNWGSDIYWFQKYPKHVEKIRKIMEISELYSAECVRDLDLATKFGFKGKFGDVLPNSGGFSISEILEKQTLPSERKAIVVKGYESFVGRASIALKAIENNADLLTEFKVHVYSANRKTIRIVRRLKKRTGLNVLVYPKKSLMHSEILDLFRQSRVYIGVSLSDGISTSLLEAIVCGTYPIQTNTSCASEWIRHQLTGSLVYPHENQISEELKFALLNNELVNNAAKTNQKTAIAKLDNEIIINKLSNFYSN